MSNNYYLAAGIIFLLSALLHTIGGQITLVDPMLQSNMELQARVEWLGAWHAITILLWVFGVIVTKNGFGMKADHLPLLKVVALLCALFVLSFVGASIYLKAHAPQYILFLPMAILLYLGFKKHPKSAS